jgi:hypothetical protein
MVMLPMLQVGNHSCGNGKCVCDPGTETVAKKERLPLARFLMRKGSRLSDAKIVNFVESTLLSRCFAML